MNKQNRVLSTQKFIVDEKKIITWTKCLYSYELQSSQDECQLKRTKKFVKCPNSQIDFIDNDDGSKNDTVQVMPEIIITSNKIFESKSKANNMKPNKCWMEKKGGDTKVIKLNLFMIIAMAGLMMH